MVRNEEKYEQAVQFRKRGFTLEEIARICGVSKSTVSKWLKNKAFSENITKQNKRRAGQENAKRLRLFSKARQVEREKKYKEAEKEAEVSYKHYAKDQLFIAGLMLYLGEGDNKDRSKIRMANSRPAVHRIFIDFLVTYLGVERKSIKFWVLLYPNLTEASCITYWNKHLKLKHQQWYKNQIINGKSKNRTLQFGVGNTIIVNTVLKHKLNRWIELAEKNIK